MPKLADTITMKDGTDITQTIHSVLSQDLEWSGTVVRATSHRALFSLYMAMQSQPGKEALRVPPDPDDDKVTDSDYPQRLNYYPRPSLEADREHYHALKVSSELVSKSHLRALSLWQIMHPDPLSHKNDCFAIPPEVRANCSLATRQKLNANAAPKISKDVTLLADVVTGSRTLLTA
ncbi:VC2046/SO_2500 family protein [Aestuariibacter sp. A3R04]|uniref:VC2046/SO_2500 family protein n=1 Tax=Aestuariibacter sp. A3R04 TaxID=2841571 RepID=UPI001C08C73C|nr:VC2046/SO_2500 family protein [Aestuariibacter sp. A3R04]MBU3022942.1 hypothetical protein [Aestuariibacter sp. A3R04]